MGESADSQEVASRGRGLLERVLLAVMSAAFLIATATFAASDATSSFRFPYVLVALLVVGYAGWVLGRRPR